MSKKIKLKIIYLDKEEYIEQCDMLVLPSINGEIGILPNHCSMAIILNEGDIKVYHKTSYKLITISAGLANITDNQCSIMPL